MGKVTGFMEYTGGRRRRARRRAHQTSSRFIPPPERVSGNRGRCMDAGFHSVILCPLNNTSAGLERLVYRDRCMTRYALCTPQTTFPSSQGLSALLHAGFMRGHQRASRINQAM